MKKFLVGDIIILTTGEYSNYSVILVGKTLKSFTKKQALLAWAEGTSRPIKRSIDFYGKKINSVIKDNTNIVIDFYPWLIREGWIEEIPHGELHTCNELINQEAFTFIV